MTWSVRGKCFCFISNGVEAFTMWQHSLKMKHWCSHQVSRRESFRGCALLRHWTRSTWESIASPCVRSVVGLRNKLRHHHQAWYEKLWLRSTTTFINQDWMGTSKTERCILHHEGERFCLSTEGGNIETYGKGLITSKTWVGGPHGKPLSGDWLQLEVKLDALKCFFSKQQQMQQSPLKPLKFTWTQKRRWSMQDEPLFAFPDICVEWQMRAKPKHLVVFVCDCMFPWTQNHKTRKMMWEMGLRFESVPLRIGDSYGNSGTIFTTNNDEDMYSRTK